MLTRIVLPDVHLPYHDVDLVKVWLDHAHKLQPDGVDIIGDMIDAYMVSRFDKNPARKTSLQDEIDMARGLLEKVRSAVGGTADIRYSEGNHEDRVRRMLWGVSKVFSDIRGLSIPELMGLKNLGIRWYSAGRQYQIGGLWYTHGDLASKSGWGTSGGGSAARAAGMRAMAPVLIGHTHKQGYATFRGWDHWWEGYECGCLCRFDMDYTLIPPTWNSGWAVVKFPKKGFCVEFVRVLNFGGKRHVLYNGETLAILRRQPNG